MKAVSRYVVRRWIPDWERSEDLKVRARYGRLAGGTSLGVNLLLFAAKLALGVRFGSVALVADAVHTLSDSATSLLVIVGMGAASRPSDRRHPFGHARLESVTALAVAVLLLVGGFELLLHGARRLASPSLPSVPPWAVAVVAGTVLVKELLARFAYHLGEMIDSQVLRADALHHRSDAYSTVLVLFALLASQMGIGAADGAAGMLVGGFVLWSGWSLAREAALPLLGAAPSRELLTGVAAAARVSPEILGIHDIVVHSYGTERFVSLHLEVPASLSGMAMHELAETAEEAVAECAGGHCTVHMDPVNREHPLYAPVAEAVAELVRDEARAESFHDLRMLGQGAHSKAVFDVVLSPDGDERERLAAVARLRRRFRERFPDLPLAVNVEPRYAYTVQAEAERPSP